MDFEAIINTMIEQQIRNTYDSFVRTTLSEALPDVPEPIIDHAVQCSSESSTAVEQFVFAKLLGLF